MLKKANRFVERLKNYVLYIHTLSLTNNFQNSRKKGKKREKILSFRSSLPEVFPEEFHKIHRKTPKLDRSTLPEVFL